MAPIRRVAAWPDWRLFAVLRQADRRLTQLWWLLVVLRALLPPGLAVSTGVLVDSVRTGGSYVGALVAVAVTFIGLQVLAPLHEEVGYNLGAMTSAWLQDRLMEAAVRPAGIEHLERADVMGDFTLARDFELHLTGPRTGDGDVVHR